jgi:hypothetical protein
VYAITLSFFPIFYESIAPIPCVNQSTSKIKALAKSSLIRIKVEAKIDFKISKVF